MLKQGTLTEMGRVSIVDLLVLTSLDKLLLILKTLFTFLQNKLSYEEINHTEPSPSFSVHWLKWVQQTLFWVKFYKTTK
jgi:hypothetical protein